MQSETKELRDTTVAAVIALLAERWPRCFFVREARRRPLKLGIHRDIRTATDGALTPLEAEQGAGRLLLEPGLPQPTRSQAPGGSTSTATPPAPSPPTKEAHAKATLAGIRTKKAAAQPAIPQPPKRLSLAELLAMLFLAFTPFALSPNSISLAVDGLIFLHRLPEAGAC